MATLSERSYTSEWLKWIADQDYCLASVSIAQDAGATEGLECGECLEPGMIVVATGANTSAILLEPVDVDTLVAGTCNRLALVRGPAVIDSDKIRVAGAEKAAALTALAVLHIVAVNSALVTWVTQST